MTSYGASRAVVAAAEVDNRAELMSVIQQAACEVLGEEAPLIIEDLKLGAGEEIDSLDLIEIVLLLEEHFDVVFDISELRQVVIVGDVIDYIVRLRV